MSGACAARATKPRRGRRGARTGPADPSADPLGLLERRGEACALFDADERLVAWSAPFVALFGAIADLIRPGAHLFELFRELLRREAVVVDGDRDAWLDTRIAHFRKGGDGLRLRLRDGPDLRLIDHPTAAGGRLCCFLEIGRAGSTGAFDMEVGAQLRAAFEHAGIAMATLRPDGRILGGNATLAALVERAPGALVGAQLADLTHDDDRALVDQALARLQAGEASARATCRLRARGGNARWSEWTLVAAPGLDCLYGFAHDLSERVQAQKEAERARRCLSDAIAAIDDGFALFDAEGRLVDCNERFTEFYPELHASGRLIGAGFDELTRELGRSGTILEARGREEAWIEERLAAHRAALGTTVHRTADGRCFRVSERRTGSGGTVLLRTDVTRLEQQARANAMLATAVEQSADAVEVLDGDYRLLYVNPAFTRLTGYRREEVLGRTPASCLRSDIHDQAFYDEIHATLAAGRPWNGRLTNRARDGSPIHTDTTITPILDRAGRLAHIVVVKRDITDRLEAERQVRHLAHHDPLTGLPNRILFHDRMEQALAQARRDGRQVALLLVDLDNFKDVNDALGHAFGDALLGAVAERLRGCVRASDTVSRWGGDEFAVLQTGLEDSRGAAVLAQKIVDELCLPLELEGQRVHIGASVGVTVFPDDALDIDQLLKNADLALYRAKAEGRGGFQFFISELKIELQARRALERDLRQGLDARAFRLVYQPQVDAASLAIVGVEVLVRWHHPERGVLAPADFLPVAEETGLIVPLTEWILTTACRQARRWLDQGLDIGHIAVNLSSAHFRHRGLVETIRQVLEATGLPPRHLELDVNEATVVQDFARTMIMLGRLHGLGVRVALDDLGSGYASIRSLRRFPFDKVKIDRSFIREVCTDAEAAAIVGAVIRLGHGLRIRVNAEGVEELEQLARLREQGCEEVQGFYLARPMSAERMGRLLREGLAGTVEALV